MNFQRIFFLLIGVLALGYAHARPSAQPFMNISRNLSAEVSAKSIVKGTKEPRKSFGKKEEEKKRRKKIYLLAT